MLDVNIEKILPVTEVRDSLNKIIDEVEATDELYVITKNGKPAAIIVGVHHLEKLTGISHKELMPDEGKTAGASSAGASSAATSDATQSSTPPASSTADDLFGDAATPAETVSASEPPPADLSIDTSAQATIAGQAPTPDSLTPSIPAPEVPVASDMAAPTPPLDNTVPAAGVNNTFATPDSATLSNADDLFGPPADAAPTAPLTIPADPNLASTPAANPTDTNQSQNQTPPAAPTQM